MDLQAVVTPGLGLVEKGNTSSWRDLNMTEHASHNISTQKWFILFIL
jgi:hypothetical protein